MTLDILEVHTWLCGITLILDLMIKVLLSSLLKLNCLEISSFQMNLPQVVGLKILLGTTLNLQMLTIIIQNLGCQQLNLIFIQTVHLS